MTNTSTLPGVPVSNGARPRAWRVLHVLDHSWPVLSGYSVRSSGLLEGQRAIGFLPHVVTSPLHQLDDPAPADLVRDEIAYTRTPLTGWVAPAALRRRWPVVREAEVVRLLERRIRQVLDSGAFDLIHAHSPALCGLAACRAARARRVPFVYEVRSFWEDRYRTAGVTVAQRSRNRLSRSLETFVLHRADAVVGISSHILNDIRTRGLAPERLFHIPNGVDCARHAPPSSRDLDLARELRLGDTPVLAFFGSLYRFEGISWLVRAASELRRRGENFRLLIIGQGEEAAAIRQAIQQTAAADYVSFLPPVPHDQVSRYYSIAHVMVYPRLSEKVTETVTPLKPLEAMSYGKPVLASSVGGLRELVEDGDTGLLFPAGDVDGFCRQSQRLLHDQHLRSELARRGREMVLREKDWKFLAQRYSAVYDAAIGHAAA